MIGKYSPENASRRKKTMLIIGPAASALGTRVLIPIPTAVKVNIPTTTVTMKARPCTGR